MKQFASLSLCIVLLGSTSLAQTQNKDILPELEPITIENAENLKQIATLVDEESPIFNIKFTSYGKLAAHSDNTVKLWNIETQEEIRQFTGLHQFVTAIALSSDERLLAAGSADRTVIIWDIDTADERFYIQPDVPDFQRINRIAFHPSKALFAYTVAGQLELWNLQNPAIEHTFSYPGLTHALAFSPDGVRIAFSTGLDTDSGETPEIIVLNLDNLEQETLRGHEALITDVVFSPNGQYLVSCSYDSSIRIWDLVSGKALVMLQISAGTVANEVNFSPDGNILAVAYGNPTNEGNFGRGIKLWDMQSNQEIVTLNHDASVNSFSFRSDGRLLASASHDGTIRLWGIPAQ